MTPGARTVAPFGTWRSPIAASLVATQGTRLHSVAIEGDDVYWLEGRPQEGGRNALVRRTPDGRVIDLVPPPFNVRTRVHEYGGGAYAIGGGDVYFSNFADQRLYRLSLHVDAGSPPVPITPPGDWFYADAAFDPPRRRLICVREDHTQADREPVNTLVAIDVHGPESIGTVIASGDDFYSTPRLDAGATMLCWLSWRHPNMPWDGTELWAAEVTASGALGPAMRVAGGPSESIYQPGWLPDGTLCFASDRDGWWTLYRATRGAGASSAWSVSPIVRQAPPAAEFGRPQWIFGTATWAPAGAERLVAAYTTAGRWRLARIEPSSGLLADALTDLEPYEWLAATARHAVLVGGSATMADAVIRVDLDTGHVDTLRRSSSVEVETGYISMPESIEFPTTGGRTAYAFYYAPRNGDVEPPVGERPPLIVISHGGPTTAARAVFDLRVQYWTSRGFAVVDVNYGGSSGFGRPFRESLNSRWGVVDVEDCIAAARHLVKEEKADPHRLIIRGGSAGGYTTLAALTFHPGVFQAGASYYGISDLEVLQQDTHKFEARYSETLVAPYPSARDVYHARSPIHFVDALACPLILFQGAEDKVVPPNQSEMMAAAVRAKGLPVAYLLFEDEQHGFRRAETIVRSLEAELYFYGKVFGFAPADATEPIPIDNLSATEDTTS
jgi:dipeptidyl aminopeptidase/acylaminoacyl peptidase